MRLKFFGILLLAVFLVSIPLYLSRKPPAPQPTSPVTAESRGGARRRNTGAIELYKESSLLRTFSGNDLQQLAKPVPKEYIIFDGQLMIRLADLLKDIQIDPASTIILTGTNKERYDIVASDLTAHPDENILITIKSPGWKLVRNLSESRGGKIIRTVSRIEVSGQGKAIQAELGDCPNPGVITSLETALKDPVNVCVLHLNNSELTRIPDGVGKLTNLRLLSFGDNAIVTFDKQLNTLVHLVDLNISRNALATLPHDIGNLKTLEYLRIGRNKLSAIPSQIGNLSNLKELAVDNNALTELPPEIGLLRSLETLKLENNKLTALPPELKNLTHLTFLEISGNPIPSQVVEQLRKDLPNTEIENEQKGGSDE